MKSQTYCSKKSTMKVVEDCSECQAQAQDHRPIVIFDLTSKLSLSGLVSHNQQSNKQLLCIIRRPTSSTTRRRFSDLALSTLAVCLRA
ncbi:hypothetical protein L1887_29996 [Cichorium endivia]|nr:hypothetical protein L1887_29996 [Cichorium endivia]